MSPSSVPGHSFGLTAPVGDDWRPEPNEAPEFTYRVVWTLPGVADAPRVVRRAIRRWASTLPEPFQVPGWAEGTGLRGALFQMNVAAVPDQYYYVTVGTGAGGVPLLWIDFYDQFGFDLDLRLLGEIAARTNPHDGAFPVTGRSIEITSAQQLAHLLANPDRQAPILVFGARDASARRAADLTAARLIGLVHTVYLSPGATAECQARFPGVTPGAGRVRMYPLAVDLATVQRADLGPESAFDLPDGQWDQVPVLQPLVVEYSRSHALPQELHFVTEDDALDVAGGPQWLTSALALSHRLFPEATSDAAALHAALEALLEVRREDDATESVVAQVRTQRELLRRAERDLVAASRHVEEVTGLLAEAKEETARAMAGEAAANEMVAELAEQLAEVRKERDRLLAPPAPAGEQEPAGDADPVMGVPGSFADLSERVGDLPGVVFTGDLNVTRALDDHLPAPFAARAWDALVMLSDYTQAKAAGEFTGGLSEYLRNPPAGRRTYPAAQFATSESDTVRNTKAWAAERTFPVPGHIEASGVAAMFAHLRLGTRRSVSPRLHLLDATGHDGRVYVGYLGRHLTNTQS